MIVDLPEPVGPSSATTWPGLTSKRDVLEHAPAAGIVEGDVFETHLAARR